MVIWVQPRPPHSNGLPLSIRCHESYCSKKDSMWEFFNLPWFGGGELLGAAMFTAKKCSVPEIWENPGKPLMFVRGTFLKRRKEATTFPDFKFLKGTFCSNVFCFWGFSEIIGTSKWPIGNTVHWFHTPTPTIHQDDNTGSFGNSARNPLFGHGRVGSDSNSTFHCVYNLNSAHSPPKLDSYKLPDMQYTHETQGVLSSSYLEISEYLFISLGIYSFSIVGLQPVFPGKNHHPTAWDPPKNLSSIQPCRVIHRRHPTMFG